MGEVYVKVRLSNAVDTGLVQRGLLRANEVRTCELDALVDTGATRSVISQEIADRLGLIPFSQATGRLADGSQITVEIVGIHFEIFGRETQQDAYILGNEVLIGQTVLESTGLLVDCTSLTVIPKHPEGPVHRL